MISFKLQGASFKKSQRRLRSENGYTLLFAVLTATLVLGAAAFILGVAQKQYALSVQARNSVYSFFAADSAIECAVSPGNWSSSGGFSSTTGGILNCGTGTATFAAVNPVSISPANVLTGDSANPVRQQQGSISLSFNNGSVTTKSCAIVTITTGRDPSTTKPTTIIDARGYNLCNATPAPDTTNNDTVERALRLTQSAVW